MKNYILFISYLIFSVAGFSQNASTYFPAQTSYKWYYQSIPLDSLNNPNESLKFFEIDSFATVTTYEGKSSDMILSKKGAYDVIAYQPYTDTSYLSFEGTNGLEYFNPATLSAIAGTVDTSLGINFLNFFASLKGWQTYYKFASTINQSYQVYSKDTTVTINSTTLPLRFQLLGKRLSDQNLTTAVGNFNCKRFLLEWRLSYLVIVNPFPPVAFKIFGIEDTLWVAPDNWIVKSFVPSTNVDLSIISGPSFTIPGLSTEIVSPITNIDDEAPLVNNEFILYQNYPNPFSAKDRPASGGTTGTKIRWKSAADGWQTLKVYDLMGREIITLVNEFRPAGIYEYNFNILELQNSKQMASGIYYYQLKIDNSYFDTKKMILIK